MASVIALADKHLRLEREFTGRRAPLSAFVIAYNREAIIGTCLRALAFADELIVIDKGSTDGTAAIAESLADRVIRVAWSPTVEETRAFAAAQCSHDWILFLDDDECLSPESVRRIDAELAAPQADIYKLPLRHYLLGTHDERAYYWPEYHIRLFRRGCVEFGGTVHGQPRLLSERVFTFPAEADACIHHLSYRDVTHWIEKTNRYTSRPDRVRSTLGGTGLGRFAHERLDHWLSRTDPCGPDDYPVVAAVLRAIYDLVDRLKTWEEEAGIDGAALLRAACRRLDDSYAAELADIARPRGDAAAAPASSAAPFGDPAAFQAQTGEMAILTRAVDVLRDGLRAQREAVDEARADREVAIRREAEQRERAAEMHRWAQAEQHRAAESEKTLGAFRNHHEAGLAEHAAAERAWQTERAALVAQQASRAEDVAMLCAALGKAVQRVRALETSTSWRITAPLRALLNWTDIRRRTVRFLSGPRGTGSAPHAPTALPGSVA